MSQAAHSWRAFFHRGVAVASSGRLLSGQNRKSVTAIELSLKLALQARPARIQCALQIITISPMSRIAFLAAAVLLALFNSASAATISKSCPPNWNDPFFGAGPSSCFVELRGNIVPGDASQLRAFLKRPGNFDVVKYGNLSLTSGGGDVLEAIKITAILKQFYIKASVDDDAVCASACFLIWIGAGTHSASPTSRIGLHRPYYSAETYKLQDGEAVAARQTRAMATVRRFLEEQNVSQRLIDTMMRRASNDVYWLSGMDREEIGGYAPWFEEVLIAECAYDKTSMTRYFKNAKANEIDAYAPWRNLVKCEQRVSGARRAAAAASSK